jgi:hypothetical protein
MACKTDLSGFESHRSLRSFHSVAALGKKDLKDEFLGLLSRKGWSDFPVWVNVETLLLLVLVGAGLALRRSLERKRQRNYTVDLRRDW